MLRDEANVHVPELVPAHSTDRLLTMTWLEGEPLLNWKSPPQDDSDRLAATCSAPGTCRSTATA